MIDRVLKGYLLRKLLIPLQITVIKGKKGGNRAAVNLPKLRGLIAGKDPDDK